MASEQALASPRGRLHLRHLVIFVLVLVVIGAAATLFGWEVGGWLERVWNTVTSIPIGYLLGAIVLLVVQTTTTAYAWYAILRSAYPGSRVPWIQVLACYATAVALNGVLPANLGTLVMLIMYTTIITAATFAGVLAGYVVQKVFYTVIGTLTYVYLFIAVGGSFDLQFGFLAEHTGAAIILLVAGVLLIVMVARLLRPRLHKWWEQAKEGGQIVVQPRSYLGHVLLPEVISWIAMLGIIAVFLGAYKIPVSFHTVMRVVAGNSIANMTSVTPGGAGVQQGFNVLSLKGITSSQTATAYSVGQQLITTAWNLLFAIALVARAFGWRGGSTLVRESYDEARVKSAEQSAARKAKREERREQRAERRADGAGGGPKDEAGAGERAGPGGEDLSPASPSGP
jgi:uncharacterized membrane protein YbhN (UPF0104 family)